MIYTLINRNKDGNISQIISFDSVQSFSESLRATISSSTVEYGFPISDNITTENPTYSLNTTVSSYSLFNSSKEIYWNGQDFITASNNKDTNLHIYMRDSIKALWENRQVISILESENESFEIDLERKYTQLTSKYSKEYHNCVITSLEIDTSESSNGAIFLKIAIEKVDVAYVEFGQLKEDQMQPPLKNHSKVVTDLGTSKTSSTDDNSKDKPDSNKVAEKKSDVAPVRNAVKTSTQIENDKLTEEVKAYRTAVGLQRTGDPSNYTITNVGGSFRLDREEGKMIVGGK